MAKITQITSALYSDMEDKWEAFRLTGEGGEAFLEEYLVKRPEEETTEFESRKEITYIPSYAKAAIQSVNNSITQRLVAVRRVGGSEKYLRATNGLDWGVDRIKSSMNKFLTSRVVPELTMMGGVGIMVDAPSEEVLTKKDDQLQVPYLYTFPVEDIRAWAVDPNDPNTYTKLLLRDYVEIYDEDFELATSIEERYRLYELEGESVSLRLFDKDGEELDSTVIEVPVIPFVYLQLSSSLLTDIWRHQVALLNLGSSDMTYAWEGNSTFLAETFDPHDPQVYFGGASDEETGTEDSTIPKVPNKRYLGTRRGIRVPKGIDYPQFISPDADPLRVSMEKQEQLRNQISELINQTLRTVSSRSSSAASKQVDERKEEDGLKAIGDELQAAENLIATYWSYFEGTDSPAQVFYPTSYQFESSADKREKARDLAKLQLLTPSKLTQKKIAKDLVYVLVGQSSTEEELTAMYAEIDNAEGVIADPEAIAKLVEMDVIDTKTAAVQIGFSEATAERAHQERILRAREIAEAQSINNAAGQVNAGARGNDAAAVNPEQEAKEEKRVSRE